MPIDADPGLTGQVLDSSTRRISVSPGKSRRSSWRSTWWASALIKNFALSGHGVQPVAQPALRALGSEELVAGFPAARRDGPDVGQAVGAQNAEEPFSAALLQDMAIPILAKESTDVYARLIAARDNGRIRLSSLESQVFGWTHGDAAGIMARHWNLPEGFAVLIESHSSIESLAAEAGPASARLAVALSALLPAGVDGGGKKRPSSRATTNSSVRTMVRTCRSSWHASTPSTPSSPRCSNCPYRPKLWLRAIKRHWRRPVSRPFPDAVPAPAAGRWPGAVGIQAKLLGNCDACCRPAELQSASQRRIYVRPPGPD